MKEGEEEEEKKNDRDKKDTGIGNLKKKSREKIKGGGRRE